MPEYQDPFRNPDEGRDPLEGLRHVGRSSESTAKEILGDYQDIESAPHKLELARNFLINPKETEDFYWSLMFLKDVVNLESTPHGEGYAELAGHAFSAIASASYYVGDKVDRFTHPRFKDLETLLSTLSRNERGTDNFEEMLLGKENDMLQAIALTLTSRRAAIANVNFEKVLADCFSSDNSALRIGAIHFLTRCAESPDYDVFIRGFLDNKQNAAAVTNAYFTFNSSVREQFNGRFRHPLVLERHTKLSEMFTKFWNDSLESEIVKVMLKPIIVVGDGRTDSEANQRHALKLLAASKSETSEIPMRLLFLKSPELFISSLTVQTEAAPFLQTEAQALLNERSFTRKSDSTPQSRNANQAALMILISLDENSPFQICRLLNRQYENVRFYSEIERIYDNFSKDFTDREKKIILKDALTCISREMPNYYPEIDTLIRSSEQRRLELAMSVIFPETLSKEQERFLRPLMNCEVPTIAFLTALKLSHEDTEAKRILFSDSNAEILSKFVSAPLNSDHYINLVQELLKKSLVNLSGKEGEYLIRRQLSVAKGSQEMQFFGDILAERFRAQTAHKGIREITDVLNTPPYKANQIEAHGFKAALNRFLQSMVDDDPYTPPGNSRTEKINNLLTNVAFHALESIKSENMTEAEKAILLQALDNLEVKSSNAIIRKTARFFAKRYGH